jgi:hypothetical protein
LFERSATPPTYEACNGPEDDMSEVSVGGGIRPGTLRTIVDGRLFPV